MGIIETASPSNGPGIGRMHDRDAGLLIPSGAGHFCLAEGHGSFHYTLSKRKVVGGLPLNARVLVASALSAQQQPELLSPGARMKLTPVMLLDWGGTCVALVRGRTLQWYNKLRSSKYAILDGLAHQVHRIPRSPRSHCLFP